MSKQRREIAHRIAASTDASFVGGPDASGQGMGWARVSLKEGCRDSPFCVANEYIGAAVGRFLGLPIPPFDLVKKDRRGYAFASLDFNNQRARMPNVIPELCAQQQPLLSTGIVLFDVLIANNDRQEENLLADDTLAPTQLVVFDHDQAVFGGGTPPIGVERLEALEGHLAISVPGGSAGGTGHCLLPYVTSTEHFDYWFERIEKLPRWLIEEACRRVAGVGIDAASTERAIAFLDYRRRHLKDIVRLHRKAFPAITRWPDFGGLFL